MCEGVVEGRREARQQGFERRREGMERARVVMAKRGAECGGSLKAGDLRLETCDFRLLERRRRGFCD